MTVRERLTKPDAEGLKGVWMKNTRNWMFPALKPETVIKLWGDAVVIDAGEVKLGTLVMKAKID